MSSIFYGGTLPMKVDESRLICNDAMMGTSEYPFYVPDVYLEGYGESYHLQYRFDRTDDSVILVREKSMTEYTRSDFLELLAKDKEGNLIWMDKRKAPYPSCWDGEYLDDMRDAKEYSITEYNLETLEKKKYKVILDETTKLDAHDYDHLKKYMDAETLDHCCENNSDGCSV